MAENKSVLSAYYNLTKPGIIYGNSLVAAAAFFYASDGALNWVLFLATIAGLACVIASACVFNNYYDRHIDAKMERTQSRAFVVGAVGHRSALLFASALIIAGTVLLGVWTNTVAPIAALAGFFSYVLLYTPLKHKSPYALFVGAFAGATPPVVGYAAASGRIDEAAAALFAFLFLWQLPHFLAISVYRGHEYASAGVPLFMRGHYTPAQKQFARGVFKASLVVLLVWCAALFML